MNPYSPSVLPAQQLEVIVLQHHGQKVDFSWQWPAGVSEVGFDRILNGFAGLPVLNGPLQFSLRCAGTPEQPLWLLVNSNPTLACTVNHERLTCGTQLRLNHGDEIELGLTRMVVSLEPTQGPVHPLELPATSSQPSAEDLPAFDLTALAAPDANQSSSGPERYGRERSDFSDLISLESSSPQPTHAPDIPAATEPLLPELDDPFLSLHQKYLDRLRDPVHADDEDRWQVTVRGVQASQTDPWEQWKDVARGSQSLDDLLGQSPSIASVIQRLDTLGNADVLEPEPFDSVMHLFAPGYKSVPAQESLESLVQHSLPGLTRREHHSVSLDSAMPLTGGTDPSNEPPSP